MGRDFEPSPLQGIMLQVTRVSDAAKWPSRDGKKTIEGVEVWTKDPKTGKDSQYPYHWPHFLREDGKLGTNAGSGLAMRHLQAVFPQGYHGLRASGGINFEDFLLGPTGQGRVFLWEEYAQPGSGEYPMRLPAAEVDVNRNLLAGKPENAFLEPYTQPKSTAPQAAAPPAPPAAVASLPPSGAPAPAAPVAVSVSAPAPGANGTFAGLAAEVRDAIKVKGGRCSQPDIINGLIAAGKGTSVGPFLSGLGPLIQQGAIRVEADGTYVAP